VWPRQYAILQLVLILSTALRLTGKYEYEHTTTTTGTDFNDLQVTVDIAHIRISTTMKKKTIKMT